MNQAYYDYWVKAGCPEDEYGAAIVPKNIIVNYNAWKELEAIVANKGDCNGN